MYILNFSYLSKLIHPVIKYDHWLCMFFNGYTTHARVFVVYCALILDLYSKAALRKHHDRKEVETKKENSNINCFNYESSPESLLLKPPL